jgi:hypothetical protein
MALMDHTPDNYIMKSRLASRRWLKHLAGLAACVCIAVAAGSCGSEDVQFISGTGTLPDCSEAPLVNLDDTLWFDSGIVLVRTAGCQDSSPGDTLTACPLNWSFSQQGNDVTIIVDEEYRIDGRICDNKLHLRGGWWLPVEDGGSCTYDDDSAAEMGIQAEGNVLTVKLGQIIGKLHLHGRCDVEYDITLAPVSDPSLAL